MLQSFSSIIYFYSDTPTSVADIWTNKDYGNVRDYPATVMFTQTMIIVSYFILFQLNELKRFNRMLKKEKRYRQSYISVTKSWIHIVQFF